MARALKPRTAELGSLRILIHSMSPVASAMAAELGAAGHAVDREPFATLDEARFREWFACVVEEWEPA